MGIGIKELIIILIIVLLLFGTKRLKSLGTDLGAAIKGFRKSVQDDEAEQPPLPAAQAEQNRDAQGQTTRHQSESVHQERSAEPAPTDRAPKS